jgi:hypothetical protein
MMSAFGSSATTWKVRVTERMDWRPPDPNVRESMMCLDGESGLSTVTLGASGMTPAATLSNSSTSFTVTVSVNGTPT